MKTVMFMIFAISMVAFGKTEKVICTAKSSASLTADTAKVRSLAAHKAYYGKKGKEQK